MGGCPVAVAQWQSTGGSSQKCPGFDSWRLLAFRYFSLHNIWTPLFPAWGKILSACFILFICLFICLFVYLFVFIFFIFIWFVLELSIHLLPCAVIAASVHKCWGRIPPPSGTHPSKMVWNPGILYPRHPGCIVGTCGGQINHYMFWRERCPTASQCTLTSSGRSTGKLTLFPDHTPVYYL